MSARGSLALPVACAVFGGVVLWYFRRHMLRNRMQTVTTEQAEPAVKRLVTVVINPAVDSSTAVAALVESTLGNRFHIERADFAELSVEMLQCGGCFVFLVEMDKEGEAAAARKLTRALRPLRLADSSALEHTHMAVLALAHSVCSFSAAQGGSDKYRGALRLQSGLVDAGARKLHELGCAEMEVDEVDVSVLPWIRALHGVLECDEQAARAFGEMMRASESAIKRRQ